MTSHTFEKFQTQFETPKHFFSPGDLSYTMPGRRAPSPLRTDSDYARYSWFDEVKMNVDV
jgi:hypothetical protein